MINFMFLWTLCSVKVCSFVFNYKWYDNINFMIMKIQYRRINLLEFSFTQIYMSYTVHTGK